MALHRNKEPDRGSYQRRSWLRIGAGLAALLLALPAAAEPDEYDRARVQHPELFKAYYDMNVLEYCGLLTNESARGFGMRRDDLVAAQSLSEEEVRRVRIAGAIAADVAYSAHGLAQVAWCNGEGMEAYNRFVERYRATPYGTVRPSE